MHAHQRGRGGFVRQTGALEVSGVVFLGFLHGGLVEDGEAGRDVERGRGFEAEGAGVVGRGVAAVEERHRGEVEAAVGEAARIDHGGEVEGSRQREVETGLQHAFEVAHVFFLGGKNDLEEQRRVVGRAGEGHHAAGDEVVRPEPEDTHDIEGARDIRDAVFALVVIAQVVAQEEVAGGVELRGRLVPVALEEFIRVKKLAARRGGQFESFRRVDLAEGTQDTVAEGVLGMAENIEAADPAGRRKEGEEDDEDGPDEKIVVAARMPEGGALSHGMGGSGARALSRGVCACKKAECL